jgi:transposase InsO family protein
MLNAILFWIRFVILVLGGHQQVALENAALRQQLAVFKRDVKRPQLRRWDRLFWIGLRAIWKDWKSALVIVRPETVISWQQKRFKRYWWRLSQSKGPGRPRVSSEIRTLISNMAAANPFWGAPRVHGELLKLGYEISERTVSRLMPKNDKKPSQTWTTFLRNHVGQMVSIDFFTVATVRLHVLYVFVILAHDRRRVLHFNVTEHPTAVWAAQQIIEAFPEDRAPRYLLRDRDGIYGHCFTTRIEGMGIEQVRITARSPWQNCYVERAIGSIRRECLNHMIVLSEQHLRRILKSYFRYYHESRTHLSLSKDAPESRAIQANELERIVQIPQLGGLHHRYERRAA